MHSPYDLKHSSRATRAENLLVNELDKNDVEDFGNEKRKSSELSPDISRKSFEEGHEERLDGSQTPILEAGGDRASAQSSGAFSTRPDPTKLLAEETRRLALDADETDPSAHSLRRQDEHRERELYLDPTPKTPRLSSSPSRPHNAALEILDDASPAPEIQSIMEQFVGEGIKRYEDEDSDSTPAEEVGLRVPIKHPPRRSSLEPLPESFPPGSTLLASSDGAPTATSPEYLDGAPMTTSRLSRVPLNVPLGSSDSNIPPSPHSSVSLPRELPPAPDPESDLPFDFHRFLEQLRHRTADPVAKYLRSFLTEFGKKQWMAHEQVKFINDFLAFIANKMAQCEIWRGISDAEYDNAKEGMEKLVMNRLYSQTFSPAIAPLAPLPGGRSKRKEVDKSLGPGRRGQHQEDVERDDILSQKVAIYGWVQEEHLDIGPVGGSGKRLLDLAQQGV